MIECANCEEMVPGEQGKCPDDCDTEENDGEPWEPGDWYWDGNRYTCPACGVVNVATGERFIKMTLEEE